MLWRATTVYQLLTGFLVIGWLLAGGTIRCWGQTSGEYRLELDHEIALADPTIDGQAAEWHTQGLYVDATHIYVTARLENTPKRPFLIRFDRANPLRYEAMDLSNVDESVLELQLDHPGGFDFDGESFWIPLARSRPDGPSVIVRVESDSVQSFPDWQRRVAWRVDDHIGALAWERAQQLLYGANWDTRQVTIWQADGKEVSRFDRSDWITGNSSWSLAIQDWKGAGERAMIGPGVLVASGIDKSATRAVESSPAVVELIRPRDRQRLARIELPPVPDWDGPVTNEGMCLDADHLFLLPGDLGRGARVFVFRLSRR